MPLRPSPPPPFPGGIKEGGLGLTPLFASVQDERAQTLPPQGEPLWSVVQWLKGRKKEYYLLNHQKNIKPIISIDCAYTHAHIKRSPTQKEPIARRFHPVIHNNNQYT